MTATALSYSYRYPFESAVLEAGSTPAMRLATSLDGTSDDLFFDGSLRQPALVGKCLTVLSSIVRTRFYQPLAPMMLDPVVTSGGGMLRFEGFSSCCGVYARVDLAPEAFDTDLRGKGTTNVDFNDAMRTALRRLSNNDNAQLQVGGEGVTLRTDDDNVVERKVKLPVRWIKGFCEVQAYQPQMTPHFELTQNDARMLFRSFPKGQQCKTARSYHADRPHDEAGVANTTRLRAVGWRRSGPRPGTADTTHKAAQYLVRRRRSHQRLGTAVRHRQHVHTGESRTESRLQRRRSDAVAPCHRPMADRDACGDRFPQLAVAYRRRRHQPQQPGGRSRNRSRLGRAGGPRAGGFRRRPAISTFTESSRLTWTKWKNNNRVLLAARKLIDANGVKLFEDTPDGPNYQVAGTDVEHFVRLRPGGDRCTCQWFNRYQGQRGPCKHILAARIVKDGEEAVDSAMTDCEATE